MDPTACLGNTLCTASDWLVFLRQPSSQMNLTLPFITLLINENSDGLSLSQASRLCSLAVSVLSAERVNRENTDLNPQHRR